jgi:hypothetical protein
MNIAYPDDHLKHTEAILEATTIEMPAYPPEKEGHGLAIADAALAATP